MVIRRLSTGAARVLAVVGVRGSVALICVVIVSSLASGRIEVAAYGFGPPLMLLGFGLVLSLLVPRICRLAGRGGEDTLAISVEVVVRNVNIALLLVHFFFPGEPAQGHLLYAILFYGGQSIPMAIPMVLRHRRAPVPSPPV